ncbi:MAG: NAD(P)/FAD-dependent oxidoreductase [Planctomycetota bacterium]|nr:MAG: NAD(P)/FAD-dependent oxidoreductase [Planctomycetota bacterium]
MIQIHYPPSREYAGPVQDRYDVIVIGAGPAGAATGTLLAEQGHSVLILERSTVPRFHIGESLIPETYWSLKRLGLIDQLKASAFPKKFSVQFFSEGMKPSKPFYFDEYNDHESSQTWQVERGDFDKMLVDNAVTKGATVRTEAHVMEVLFDGDQAVGVKVKFSTGEVREIACRVVADASGQSSFLVHRLNLKTPDTRLKKASVWSYFQGARRDPGRDEGATLILQTEGKTSWFWYIPLRNDIVSVGCTGATSYMFSKGVDPESVFQRELGRCPALQERLQGSTRYTEYFATKDYSYISRQAAGPGWVLVGDACGFIDPVYSSGVYLAMKSGEFVADAVDVALRSNDLSQQALGSWYPTYHQGVENFRKLVYAFYTPGFSFGEFFRQHPQYRSHMTDILIGAVFKPGVDEIFQVMGEVLPPEEVTLAG